MSEMIERVAKAIAADESQRWDELDGFGTAMYRSFATAAIKAMREPTEAMVGAREVPGVLEGSDTRLVWMAMIDAALSPSPQEST